MQFIMYSGENTSQFIKKKEKNLNQNRARRIHSAPCRNSIESNSTSTGMKMKRRMCTASMTGNMAKIMCRQSQNTHISKAMRVKAVTYALMTLGFRTLRSSSGVLSAFLLATSMLGVGVDRNDVGVEKKLFWMDQVGETQTLVGVLFLI